MIDPVTLQDLPLKPVDKVRNAVVEGDIAKALKLSERMPEEYVRRARRSPDPLGNLMTYAEDILRVEQPAITGQIRAAIAAGDKAKVFALLDQKKKQHRVIHHLHIDTMAAVWSAVYQLFGAETLYECLRHGAEQNRRGYEAWAALSVDDFLRSFVDALSAHCGNLSVDQDEEKYIIVQDPCGSGGRLFRDGYYEPPRSLARVRGPSPMTLQRESIPVYCTHCPILLGVVYIEWFGRPMTVMDPPKQPNDPCVCHVYKDPKDIPANYYELLGKRKP